MTSHAGNGKNLLLVPITIMLLLVLGGRSLAQGIGTIVGTVHDQTGAAIVGAAITIRNTQTDVSRTVTCDTSGYYSSSQLPVGEYEVSAQAHGFATVVRTGINLLVAQTIRVDFALQISRVQEKIVVSEDAPLVDVQSASLGDVEVSSRIEELPLNKRDFYQLSVLQPGVLPPFAGRGSIGTPQVAGGMESQPQVNGLRESNNYTVLDGGFVTDPYFNTATVVPNPDAIAEFKIQTNLTSVRYGRGGGAVINVVTKSGSNQFHGGLYEFFRNNVFDARNYFVEKVPALNRHQFGANFGGPLQKNKNFVFVSYEGLRQIRGEPISAVVPSIANRNGDFSSSPPGSVINPFTNLPFSGPLNFDPALINPLAQKVLKLYPTPNVANQDTLWSGAPVGREHSDQGILRWDDTLGQRQSVGARYIYQNQTALKNFQRFAFSGPISVPGFPTQDRSTTSNLTVWHVFAANRLTNDLRFTYQHNNVTFSRPVGTTGRLPFGFTFPQAGQTQLGDAFPQFGIGGYSGIGNADGDVFRLYQIYQLQDSVTYTYGKHTFSAGAEVNRFVMDSHAYFVRMGIYFSLGFFSGNPVADMLLGMPSFFSGALGDPTRNFRSTGFNWFAEDSYRLNPRFTLTYGLRYELQSAPIETHNRLALFSPENAAAGIISARHPEAPPGMVFAGDPGFPRSLVPSDKNNFAPRLSFAWDVTGRGTTSLRSGFGIFYDVAPIIPYADSSLDPPEFPLFFYTPDPFNPNTFANPIASNPSLPQTQADADKAGTTVLPLSSLFGPGIHNRSPYVKQWNLSVQRAITSDLGITVAYVGNSATKLLGSVEINEPVFIPGQSTIANSQGRRPYPLLNLIYDHGTRFASNYNGLQISASKRMSHGVSFVGAYTWSKTIDYNSQAITYYHILGHPVFPQNSYNLKAERGLSSFDVPQRFVLSGTWNVPGPGKSANAMFRRVLGDWQMNGIVTVSSGYPFTVVDSLNPSTTGEYGPTDRPNLVGDPNAGPHSVARWFNTAAFQAVPAGGGFGSAGRNIVRGPGLRTVDYSVFKNFDFGDKYKVQFRAECFNLFNHPNFLPPDNDISSPTFGRITETSTDAREIQLGLKISF
jgi:hypothetical protein